MSGKNQKGSPVEDAGAETLNRVRGNDLGSGVDATARRPELQRGADVVDLREPQSAPIHRWLQDGEILLHIGPPKTGTTALQSALAASRPELLDLGVLYPGGSQQHKRAAASALRRPIVGRGHYEPVDPVVWERFLAELSQRDDRAVVSSETFARAGGKAIHRIAADLGKDSFRVLITLRPLDRILPSVWQQELKYGSTESLDQWLRPRIAAGSTDLLWRYQRHDELVRRWAGILGPDRVAVMPLGVPGGNLMRDFEDLIGLDTGLLSPTALNRSFTAPEAEVLLQLNRRAGDREWDPVLFHKIVRRGAVVNLLESRTPPADEPRITLPEWSQERVGQIQAEIQEGLQESGVRLLRDLDGFSRASGATVRSASGPEAQSGGGVGVVANDIAVELLAGLVDSANDLNERVRSERAEVAFWRKEAGERSLHRQPGTALLKSLVGRVLARVGGVFRRQSAPGGPAATPVIGSGAPFAPDRSAPSPDNRG